MTSRPLSLTASLLVDFSRCRQLAAYRLDRVRPAEADESAKLVQAKGVEHEIGFRDTLSDRVDIPEKASREEKIATTLAAMKAGAAWIYHGALAYEGAWGEPDFLKRIDGDSALGAYHYEPWDTKLGKTLKAEHVLQLCHYASLLAAAQGRMPERACIVDGERKTHEVHLAEFLSYYRNLVEGWTQFAAARPKTEPYPIAHCDLCGYQAQCQQFFRETDHLSGVLGIRRSQVEALAKMNVTSRATLAAAPESQFTRAKGLSREGFLKLKRQAETQRSGKHAVRSKELLATLPSPSSGDIFFDMESDPYVGETGLEYLHGLWVREGKQEKFESFWALTPNDEKVAFERTMDRFQAFREKHPEMRIYHFGAYEPSRLAKLASRHATREEELDVLLRASVFVDLYSLVKRALWMPVESLSLKVIEPYIGFERTGEVKGAGSSIVFFENWLETGDQALLDAIESYNRTDVIATAALYDWLLKVRGE